MASYEQIVNQLKAGKIGDGVKKSSQRPRKKTGIKSYGTTKKSLEESSGICAGLVIRWLKSKKQDTDFWAATEKKSSLSLIPQDYKFYSGVYTEHQELKSAKHTIGKDEAYKNALKGVVAYSRTNSQATDPSRHAIAIANTILTDNGRFFILSLAKTAGGAHAVGFYRKKALWGNKNWASFYDPNKGEFWGYSAGIRTILSHYSKWDKAYTLRIFV